MKTIFIILMLILLTAGCSSHCNFKKVAADFDKIFIAQYKDGVQSTSENWNNVKEFIVEDINTAGSRLGNTVAKMYRPVSIEGTSERMNFYAKTLERQFHDGVERTARNFKTIAQHLCLCGD